MKVLVQVVYKVRHLLYALHLLTLDWGDRSIIERAILDDEDAQQSVWPELVF